MLKLNYKRTFFIGCAFFSILMLWQVYNTYCPLMLQSLLADKFNVENELTYVIGIIMAADNLFALFMLPIFGKLSDKTNTKYGKRMPYIIVGMVLSALLFPLIVVCFMKGSLSGVIIMMGIILIIMNAYRNPAVALMPDVTPKPLRSGANGIINLVGYIGAVIAGALAMFLKTEETYLFSFLIASAFLIIAAVILILTINENKILVEVQEDMALGEKMSQSLEEVSVDKPLSKSDKKNMWILLIAILFWFISFNAIETFNSLYCQKILNETGLAGTFTIILTVSSIITFALLGTLSNKIGRKYTVLIGLASIILGIIIICIYSFTPLLETGLVFIIYIAVVFIGVGWALVNINSYPMIVEMANKNNIGVFTGRYYTFSMIGQTVTPVLVGLIMSFNDAGLKLLYVYSLVTMIIAAVIFFFVQERATKKREEKKGFAAFSNPDE